MFNGEVDTLLVYFAYEINEMVRQIFRITYACQQIVRRIIHVNIPNNLYQSQCNTNNRRLLPPAHNTFRKYSEKTRHFLNVAGEYGCDRA